MSIQKKQEEQFHPCCVASLGIRFSSDPSFCSENICFPCAVEHEDLLAFRLRPLDLETGAATVLSVLKDSLGFELLHVMRRIHDPFKPPS